jgi:hypothetical protein
MASNTNISWSTWSLSTKITVGIGLALATAFVVWMYLPH